METIQGVLILLAIINLIIGISNRIANNKNHKKLKEILIEEKKQTKGQI